MFPAPGLPWWSPIQVLTEIQRLNFSERANELVMVQFRHQLYPVDQTIVICK